MHYQPDGNSGLNHAVFDVAHGYMLAPMQRGIRLTTGAEFAHRDAPPDAGAARPRRAFRTAAHAGFGHPARPRAMGRRAALHARHAAHHRAGARRRPASGTGFGHGHQGPHARADHRPAAGGDDDRGDVPFHRSGRLQPGPVLTQQYKELTMTQPDLAYLELTEVGGPDPGGRTVLGCGDAGDARPHRGARRRPRQLRSGAA